MPRTKRCPKCKEELPLTEEYFYKTKKGPGGYTSWCKNCQKNARKPEKRSYCNARLDRPRFTHGSRWSGKPRRLVGDFSGNNELLIYMDLNRDDGISNVITTDHIRKAQALANVSGNPRIWTEDKYSQAYLRSLIPSRQ
jgi:hypothetical protein